MTDAPAMANAPIVAGVDGCPAGWIAVFRAPGRPAHHFRVFARFADLLSASEAPAIVAVDMPIGLPDTIAGPGRGPEQAVRPLLGARQSSVFSIPSRRAVMAATYRDACAHALETSDPPKKVSRQAFNIFPKIREIDALMTPALEPRVYEVHPELAFWRLNGEAAMTLPKKVKSRPNPDGISERRRVLERHGFGGEFLQSDLPRGVAADDFIDACANAAIAARILDGKARSFPAEPRRDKCGLRVAIWA